MTWKKSSLVTYMDVLLPDLEREEPVVKQYHQLN